MRSIFVPPRRQVLQFAGTMTPLVLCCVLLGGAAGADDPGAQEGEELPAAARPVGEPVEGFYQDVDIQRQPTLRMQGFPITQNIHYQIRSFFTLYTPDDSGRQSVTQEIQETKLVDADALSRTVFEQSLAKLKGKRLTYTVDKEGKVFAFTGYTNTQKNVEVKQDGLTGAMITDVIDEDGWKELAQLTLFRPKPGISRNDTFQRRTSHDWGSLGSWYGTTAFKQTNARGNLQEFGFEHKLEYIKPIKSDKPSLLVVNDATFKTLQSNGSIQIDGRSKRVRAVREWFHVRGTVATEVLGTKSDVAIEEKQMMTISVKAEKFAPRGGK